MSARPDPVLQATGSAGLGHGLAIVLDLEKPEEGNYR